MNIQWGLIFPDFFYGCCKCGNRPNPCMTLETPFKEMVSRDFLPSIFSWIEPTRAILIHRLKQFEIWWKFRRDIQSKTPPTGVLDTAKSKLKLSDSIFQTWMHSIYDKHIHPYQDFACWSCYVSTKHDKSSQQFLTLTPHLCWLAPRYPAYRRVWLRSVFSLSLSACLNEFSFESEYLNEITVNYKTVQVCLSRAWRQVWFITKKNWKSCYTLRLMEALTFNSRSWN